ncbi:MAG: YfiR family protein [Gammaproteobacteria bacterium]|nr:MAG: YfiR family protein [Gammaproteobacteria bacterium]
MLKRAIISCIFFLLPLSVAEGASNEAALRVAFVYKFIKFIEWPNQVQNSSLRLCALGADVDAKAALQPLNGQPASQQVVNGNVIKQTIEVFYLDDSAAVQQHLKTCQMLYRPSHASPIPIPHPPPAGVFLVADDPRPTDEDVGIALARNTDGRIEFSISSVAVSQAGVSISSQLLRLAKNSQVGR